MQCLTVQNGEQNTWQNPLNTHIKCNRSATFSTDALERNSTTVNFAMARTTRTKGEQWQSCVHNWLVKNFYQEKYSKLFQDTILWYLFIALPLMIVRAVTLVATFWRVPVLRRKLCINELNRARGNRDSGSRYSFSLRVLLTEALLPQCCSCGMLWLKVLWISLNSLSPVLLYSDLSSPTQGMPLSPSQFTSKAMV